MAAADSSGSIVKGPLEPQREVGMYPAGQGPRIVESQEGGAKAKGPNDPQEWSADSDGKESFYDRIRKEQNKGQVANHQRKERSTSKYAKSMGWR